MASVTDVGVDVVGVRELYEKNATARLLLDYFATRQRNSTETKTDGAIALLQKKGHRTSRGDVIAVFRALESTGCGTYIEGRHRHPSRFQWKADMVSVGRAAAGGSAPVAPLDAAAVREEDDDAMLPHDFRLRPDLVVRFELPADLSSSEASRIAEFVKALPFS